MNDYPKTTADIIAEMRMFKCRNLETGELETCVVIANYLADRLEAALKREKAAIEADALAVGGLVEASRATTENSSAVGNAAKWREALVDIKTGLVGKMDQAPALMTPHEVAILKRCEAALAESPRNCDKFVDEKQADALHEAFIEYCNGCDCPMGCDYRRNPRFLLDTNCASIMKCFSRFALSRATPAKGGTE